jgi:hypothetical protein
MYSHSQYPARPMDTATARQSFASIAPTGAVAAAVAGFMARHRRKLPWVHAGMFLLFVVLLLVPPLLPQPVETAGVFDDYRLFANAVLWGVWFPLVFLSVLLTGRSWCGLFCPMGAASEWAGKHGLNRTVPAWLRWPGTPIVSFVAVTIWAQTLGARDHAESAALLFGGVMVLAVAAGFVYGRGKRVWCRHACPVGLLLGVYARLGAVDFRPKRPQAGGDRWTEATACPTLIDLKRKTESRHCIECFRCVNPRAKGGLDLVLRRPGTEVEDIGAHNGNLAEVLFLFLGAGLAAGGFLWLVLESYQTFRLWLATTAIKAGHLWIGEPGPRWLMAVYPEAREVFRWIDFLTITAYMLGWMTLTAAVLSATTALAAWAAGRAGASGGVHQRFVRLGYQVAPVAMVSLLLGLGGDLFAVLGELGLADDGIRVLKTLLFLAGAGWSLHLSNRLLANLGVPARRRPLPLALGALGTVYTAAVWASAVLT